MHWSSWRAQMPNIRPTFGSTLVDLVECNGSILIKWGLHLTGWFLQILAECGLAATRQRSGCNSIRVYTCVYRIPFPSLGTYPSQLEFGNWEHIFLRISEVLIQRLAFSAALPESRGWDWCTPSLPVGMPQSGIGSGDFVTNARFLMLKTMIKGFPVDFSQINPLKNGWHVNNLISSNMEFGFEHPNAVIITSSNVQRFACPSKCFLQVCDGRGKMSDLNPWNEIAQEKSALFFDSGAAQLQTWYKTCVCPDWFL